MIVHGADVLAGFSRQWDARNLNGLVPGGLHWIRVPETVNGEPVLSPYATIRERVTLYEEYPGLKPTFRKDFEVTLMVWSNAGVVDAGDIQGAIDLAFDRDRCCAPSGNELQISGAIVLDLMPTEDDFDNDPANKEGKDVVMLTRKWSLVLQGER